MSVKYTVTVVGGANGAIEPFHFTQYTGDGTPNSSFDVDRAGNANSRPTLANADLNAAGYVRFKQFQLKLSEIAAVSDFVVTTTAISGGVIGKSVPRDVANAGTLPGFEAEITIDNASDIADLYDQAVHGAFAVPASVAAYVDGDGKLTAPEFDAATAYSAGDVVYVPTTDVDFGNPNIAGFGGKYYYAEVSSPAGNEFADRVQHKDAELSLRWNSVTGEYESFEAQASVSGWVELPEFSDKVSPETYAKAAAVLKYELEETFTKAITMREARLIEHQARDWDPTQGGTVTLAPRAFVDMGDVTSAALGGASVDFEQFWR